MRFFPVTIPADTVSLADYERHFHERAAPGVRAYVSGYAADGISFRENRAALDALRLVPRILRDLSGATARSEMFGLPLDCPIILAPVAYHKLVHPDGEIATVMAAGMTRTWMTVSTQASVTLEEIARHASAPLWFQLYCQFRPEDTLKLVRRAEDAGYKALVLTADAPINGIRNVEQRTGFALPQDITAINLRDCEPRGDSPMRAGSPVFQGILDGAPTWKTLEWLCGQTSLPVLVKGVLHPDDAAMALDAGARGIIVSNHGGRVLDTVPAPVYVLAGIAGRIRGRVPVLLDGGIRRGTDVLKAIALGADAVLVGRPQLHALQVGGLSGVAHMLTILQTEFEAAMALMGLRSIGEADANLIWPASGSLAPIAP